MIKAKFSSTAHNHLDGETTYWFTIDGTDYGTDKTFNNEMFGIADNGTTKTVLDHDAYPVENEYIKNIVLRDCKITDEMKPSSDPESANWLRLTDLGKDRMLQWLESVVRDFENNNKEIWIERIEQTANNTLPDEDIVFEVRGIEAIDRNPVTVTILRNCFTNG